MAKYQILNKRKKMLYFLIVVIGITMIKYKSIKIFVEQRFDDKTFNDKLGEFANFQPKISYYEVDRKKIRFLEIGTKGKPILFLIHGAPSSSHSWMNFISDRDFLSNYLLIVVDRLGYGYSEFGVAHTSLNIQANIFKPLIDSLNFNYPNSPITLVASSFGCPVALKIAINHPTLIDGLILISGTYKPKEEKIYWFSHFFKDGFLKKVVPGAFQVANEEKFSHEQELGCLESESNNLTIKTLLIHGDNDKLVYFNNSVFLFNIIENKNLSNKLITLAGKGHFLPWNSYDIIKREIFQFN